MENLIDLGLSGRHNGLNFLFLGNSRGASPRRGMRVGSPFGCEILPGIGKGVCLLNTFHGFGRCYFNRGSVVGFRRGFSLTLGGSRETGSHVFRCT